MAGVGPKAAVIVGEPGIGKTALAIATCETAASRGWAVLQTVGVEAEKAFTLSGLNQIVVPLRDHVSSTEPSQRPLLIGVLTGDPDTPPAPVPLAFAVVTLLTIAARDRPLLVVVDDIHWLDEVSATVLSVAGRRLTDPRLRLLATYRPHAAADFVTAGWHDVAVKPLPAADARVLLERSRPGLNPRAATTILDMAAGNPLALEELPRHAEQIDQSSTSLPLTDRLVTVFGGRLRQLDPRVRTEMLRAALGPRYLMEGVDDAIAADLLIIDPMGDVVFRHPLVRAAVIHQASAGERRTAHAHLAELYRDAIAHRATHLSAAATGPDQHVADLLEEAARQSIQRGGSSVAVDWLRRAAELSTDAARRDAFLSEAAFVASQAGRYDDAQAIEESSSVLTDAYLGMYKYGEVRVGHRRLVNAVSHADDVDDDTLARLVNLLLAITQYTADAELWGQTLAAVDRLGDRSTPESRLFRDSWGDVARTGHTVAERLSAHMDSLPALDPWDVMRLAVAAYYVDRLAEFRTTVSELMHRERDRGAVTNAMTMGHLVFLDMLASGDWAGADTVARDGLALTEIHHNELFKQQFSAYLGLLAASRGEVDSARRLASNVEAYAQPRGVGLLVGYTQRIDVLCALSEGDYEGAYTAAVRIGAPGEFPPFAYQAVDTVLDLVEAAVHTGRVAEARQHVRAAVQLDLPSVSPRLAALTIAAEAMCAPDELAAERYETALAEPGLSSVPFEQARVQLSYGMWLRRQRQNTRSRVRLRAAATTFDALGATAWAARAHNELRAAGVDVKPADGAALSAQERKIAELAAQGQSNKQIAATLYLSPRTVSAHLYRVFPKLGVTSRAGLAKALAELDTA